MRIDRIWSMQPGEWFFVCTKSKDRWLDKAFRRTELNRAIDYIKANSDKDIYVCPQGFSKPERKEQYAVAPFLLWADLDPIRPESINPKPTMAWETSPGRYAALWVTDKAVGKELNERWNKHIGADKGSFIYTKVLRLWPGATNYKYPAKPKVKLLWGFGESVTVAEIEKLAPPLKSNGHTTWDNWDEVYSKYESKLSFGLRRELMRTKVDVGKRSEMLWKLENELLEAGCTRDEAFVLIRKSAWNKFLNRRNGDDQLRAELDKAVAQHARHKVDLKEPTELQDEYGTIDIFKAPEENIEWIWRPHLARRKLTILEGDPGGGKSYLSLIIGAFVATGEKLPGETKAIKGPVVIFDRENDVGDTIVKRLNGNKVNKKNACAFRIDKQAIDPHNEEDVNRVFSVLELYKPALVVFDTLNHFVGSTDMHRSNEVTQVLDRLFVQMAETYNCSVIVLRHLTKNTTSKALDQGQGSVSLGGIGRFVIRSSSDPDAEDNNQFLLSWTKPPNSADAATPALHFSIDKAADEGSMTDRSSLSFGEFSLKYQNSQDIVDAWRSKSKEDKFDDTEAAIEFLQEYLKKPTSIRIIKSHAATKGIELRFLKKAIAKIGSVEGTGEDAIWELS
jgi:hypothetical protein